jgi:hypothetical protein
MSCFPQFDKLILNVAYDYSDHDYYFVLPLCPWFYRHLKASKVSLKVRDCSKGLQGVLVSGNTVRSFAISEASLTIQMDLMFG